MMVQPTPRWLELEQHRLVIQAFAQNPTIASHVKAAITQSGRMDESVNIQLSGHEYAMMMSKKDWPASGQTLASTTTMKDTPTASRTNMPTKHTSSLPAVIPSILETQPPRLLLENRSLLMPRPCKLLLVYCVQTFITWAIIMLSSGGL